jgi:metallo-beta-lactamase family protein
MQIEFQGAARTVTGSMHLLSVNGRTILLDCGLFQGRRDEARQRNSTFPFDTSSVEAVVLSHAHIDHSGNLPGLVRQGFRGPIYSTHATRSLCAVMLKDSAFIQEKDVEFVNRRHQRKGLPPVEPLYTAEDAARASALFRGMDYGAMFEVAEGVQARFEDAGHILGSAAVALTLREGNSTLNLAFTGDLGRPGLPILRDPVHLGPDFDYVISESTYGGRFHLPVAEMEDQLLEPILRASRRRGKIIIPAFSVGRTQEIVYTLHKLSKEGKIDHLPVYVDSPLSMNVTNVFRAHPECFDEEVHAVLNDPADNDPFGFDRLTYIRDAAESMELNEKPGPFVVIAASGMAEAGRVLHHLHNGVGDAKNMVLIVGYQSEHTLGRKLVEKEPVVNIFGDPHEVRAEVVVLNSFSGHADRSELLAYLTRFDRARVRGIFMVHGDPDQSEKLAAGVREAGYGRVAVPARGDTVPLTA